MINRIIILMLSFGIISQSALIKAAEVNFTIIQRINREAAAELSSELIKKNIRIGKLNLSAHSSKDYLESEMLNSLISNKLLDTSSKNYISIEIFDNNVYYQLYESDSDSLIRLNKLSIAAKTFNESAALLDFHQIEKSIIDTISRDDIDYIQTNELAFTKSVPPAKETSFWETIASPLLITGSAILTVYLLFSVRSK